MLYNLQIRLAWGDVEPQAILDPVNSPQCMTCVPCTSNWRFEMKKEIYIGYCQLSETLGRNTPSI